MVRQPPFQSTWRLSCAARVSKNAALTAEVGVAPFPPSKKFLNGMNKSGFFGVRFFVHFGSGFTGVCAALAGTKDQKQNEGGSNYCNNDVDQRRAGEACSLFRRQD